MPANGDETWTHPPDELDHRYVWGLAVDAGEPERMVVSAARGARSAHTPARAEAYVYRLPGELDVVFVYWYIPSG